MSVADLDRTLALYRDQFGLSVRTSAPSDAEFGGLVGASQARLRLGTTTLPGTNMTLEFLEVTGVERSALDARIQDPGAARIQLTVTNIEATLQTLRAAGPSTVVSTGGRIITQPRLPRRGGLRPERSVSRSDGPDARTPQRLSLSLPGDPRPGIAQYCR